MAEIVSFRSNRSRCQQTLPSPRFLKARRTIRLPLNRYAGFLALLAMFVAAAYAFEPWRERASPTLGGFATIVDGDTLRIRKERVRLVGIDAPEIKQTCRNAAGRNWPCGRAARDRLVALIAGSEVTCSAAGRDKYGRTLAVCKSSGDDLGEALVREGHAVAYGEYKLAELGARLNNRGIWAGEFERPNEWRRTHRR